MKRIKVIVIFSVLWHLIQGMALKVDFSKDKEDNYKSLVKKKYSTDIQSGISGIGEDLNSGSSSKRYNFDMVWFKNHNFFLPLLNLKQSKKKEWLNRKFQIYKTLNLTNKNSLSTHAKLLLKKHIVEDTFIRRPAKYFNTQTTSWKKDFNWKNKIRENNLIHVVSKRSALNNIHKNNNNTNIVSQLEIKNNKVRINESRTEEEHVYLHLENATNIFVEKGAAEITPVEFLIKDIEKKQNELITAEVILDSVQEPTYESPFIQKESVNNSDTVKMSPGEYSSTENTRNTFIEKPMTYSDKSLFSFKTKDVSQVKNKYENFKINKNDQQMVFKKGHDNYSVTQQSDVLRVQVSWKTVSVMIPVRTTTEAINFGMIISAPNRSCPPGYRRYQHKCRLVF